MGALIRKGNPTEVAKLKPMMLQREVTGKVTVERLELGKHYFNKVCIEFSASTSCP